MVCFLERVLNTITSQNNTIKRFEQTNALRNECSAVQVRDRSEPRNLKGAKGGGLTVINHATHLRMEREEVNRG